MNADSIKRFNVAANRSLELSVGAVVVYDGAALESAVGAYREREYRDEETGGLVRASMRPCRIRKAVLPTAPSVGDTLTMEDGRVMRIHVVHSDPTDEAHALWLMDKTEAL
jgi:hypothetical protein